MVCGRAGLSPGLRRESKAAQREKKKNNEAAGAAGERMAKRLDDHCGQPGGLGHAGNRGLALAC